MSQTYEDRLRRVIRYIHDTPAGDLSLDALADVAAMSRFHWHRVFHAMTGETCAQAVRRIRLHRAAHWLVGTNWPVATISMKAGFANTQSFARAFRNAYGMTPDAFRRTGAPGALHVNFTPEDIAMLDVTIRAADPIRLAALPHRGAYPEIGKAFQQLAAIFSARHLWPQARGMVAIYHDDPSSVPALDLRSHAGVRVGPDFDMPDVLEDVTIPAGRQAVLLYKGPYAGLPAAWDALYGQWLAQSGEEPDDAPAFEIYLNDPSDTAPADLLTEVCVPLRNRDRAG